MRFNIKIVIILLCLCVAVFYAYSARPDDFSTIECLEFSAGEGSTDVEKTLSSLSRVQGADGLYLMTYYGDYQERLEQHSEEVLDLIRRKESKWKCSLVSLNGDKSNPVYGRNFDFEDSGILVTRYQPPNKLDSIAFTPMIQIGLSKDFEPDTLSDEKRQLALRSAFLSTCGMNEKGVSVALATTAAYPTRQEEGLKYVYVTRWIREILDNASDVDEAIDICKKLRVYDDLDTIQHHILITDASGKSITVEHSKGEWQFINDKKPWQVATNGVLYNKTEEERKQVCWRYKKASEMAEEINGKGDWMDAMKILKAVSQGHGIDKETTGTLLSFTADIANRTIYLCIHSEYDKVYQFGFN